jgi:uncharacterized membrane protein YeaQ/YmgE (transglycosylase-associated protein family)
MPNMIAIYSRKYRNFCGRGTDVELIRQDQGGTMAILGWIVFGLIVGIVAKLLMPGRDPGGFIVTMLLGVVGAMIGGFIGRAMGFYGPNQGAGFLMSVLGAILVLFIYRRLSRRTA